MNQSKQRADYLFSLATALLVLTVTISQVRFWDVSSPMLIGAFRYSFLLISPLFIIATLLVRGRVLTLRFVPEAFAASLLFVFFSDWLVKEWVLFDGPMIRGEIVFFSLVGAVLLNKTEAKQRVTVFTTAALLVSGYFLFEFLRTSEGRLLFSDDNGPVLYRLSMLKTQFPFIPFYNPEWNAGLDARDFFATGILNFFLLFSPIIYSTELLHSYTFLVGVVLFVLLPASCFLAARILRFTTVESAVVAILSLSTSLVWYRWGLKYGSMGFVTSATLFPLVAALIMRTKNPEDAPSRRLLLLLLVAGSLMIMWTMSGIALAPLLVLGLFHLPRLLKRRGVRYVLIAAIALNLPWMMIFLSASKVGTFLSLDKHRTAEFRDAGLAETSGASQALTAKSVKGVSGSARVPTKSLREFLITMNPLLLTLFLPGLFLLPARYRWQILLLIGWLWFLGTIGKAWRPQLELDRMLVLSGLLLIFPVAKTLSFLFQRPSFASAISLGFLISGVFASLAVVNNRSLEVYAWAEDEVGTLPQLIDKAGNGGRTIFLGFVLHELSRGHLAPLPLLTKEPLIASSPFHNVWWYTDVVPPLYAARGAAGIEEFLNLMNATTVITHDPQWESYVRNNPDRYQFVGEAGEFSVFQRAAPSEYFLEGSGAVLHQQRNDLTIRVDTANVILKFNYFYFLRSTSCSITGREVIPGVPFISLTGCAPGTEVTISGVSGLSRLFARGYW